MRGGDACGSGDLSSAFASMTVDSSGPGRAFSDRLDAVDIPGAGVFQAPSTGLKSTPDVTVRPGLAAVCS